MKVPIIQPEGLPGADGVVTCFVDEELRGKEWFTPNKPVIFINGIQTTPDVHKGHALRLSRLLCAPVYGIYNATVGKGSLGGLAGDLWECLNDKVKFASLQKPDQAVLAHGSPGNVALMRYMGPGALTLPPRSDFNTWSKIIEDLYQLEKAGRPGLSKDNFVYGMLGNNAATKALYALLLSGAASGGVLRLPIYAHSQGNLIASNALTGVALARGPASIRGLEVNSYGSPVQGWPDGLNRTNNAFTFDAVGMFDLTADLSSSKVGYRPSYGLNPLIHDFEFYVKSDPEFFINRFRTGGWGMTLSMKEKELAAALVNLGNNIPRLSAIFERLKKSHWSDSDDVTVEYVTQQTDEQLKAVCVDKNFADLLIDILHAGYTAKDEKTAIARLKAAKPVT